jgi:protein-tyrosine phosphatase
VSPCRYRQEMAGFVDVHSHVIPSGDDGARDLEEGLEVCRLAAAQGTRILYGTPHAHPPGAWLSMTPERYRLAVTSYELMKEDCAAFGLELRLGWELAPGGVLVGEIEDYALEGADAVLLEFPGPWFSFRDPLEATRRQIAAIRAAGLAAILAHPERCLDLQREPELALPFVEDGALVCFNADSFLGVHGRGSERCAWRLADLGIGDLVASDAHRLDRPSRLREAVDGLAGRYGAVRANELVDGSALTRLARAPAGDQVDERVTFP